MLLLSGCISSPAAIGSAERASGQPDPSGGPSSQPTLSAPPQPADTEAAVLEEVVSDSRLEVPVDDRLVGLTRDDFLSASRREDGREIVGGGLFPKTQFWFVLGPDGRVATAAWVEQRRTGTPAGAYALPADPLHDLIEIVLPELSSDEADQLGMALEIEDGNLPAAGTDVVATVDGVRFHLLADDAAVFLVATSAS